IEAQFRRRRLPGRLLTNVDAASVTQLEPSSFLQVLVRGADGIRMDAKSASQLAGAGQACAGLEGLAEDRQHNLCYQLLANWYFAGMRDPEAHLASRLSKGL